MPAITVGEISCYYALGKPPDDRPERTILFVHGAGGSHRHWLPQLQALKDNCHVYVVDLPGHGRSAGQPYNCIAGYREFIRALASNLFNDQPFYLAGHSMGGAITLDFARLYPGLLKGMILVGTGARLRVRPDLLETFRSGKNYDLTPLVYSSGAPEVLLEAACKEAAAVPPAVYLADFTACDHFDLTASLPQIKVPALVVSAEQDLLTPLKYGKFLKDKLPKARMAVVREAGHMMMLEQPEQVNKYLCQFLLADVPGD